MTRTEHLLTILSEECAEVAQRASKALRFGLTEVEAGQTLANRDRIMREIEDLLGLVAMLTEEGLIPYPSDARIQAKVDRVEKWLLHSKANGTLTEAK